MFFYLFFIIIFVFCFILFFNLFFFFYVFYFLFYFLLLFFLFLFFIFLMFFVLLLLFVLLLFFVVFIVIFYFILFCFYLFFYFLFLFLFVFNIFILVLFIFYYCLFYYYYFFYFYFLLLFFYFYLYIYICFFIILFLLFLFVLFVLFVGKNVETSVKASARLEKSKEVTKFFDDNEGDHKLPPEVREYKVPDTAKEYDDTYSETVDRLYTVTIDIPHRMTRREAIRIGHWQFMRWVKQVEEEAADARHTTVRAAASKAEYMLAMTEVINQWLEKQNPVVNGAEPAQTITIPAEVGVRHLEQSYAELLRQMGLKQRNYEKKQEAESKAKSDAEKMEADANPTNLLKTFVVGTVQTEIAVANGMPLDDIGPPPGLEKPEEKLIAALGARVRKETKFAQREAASRKAAKNKKAKTAAGAQAPTKGGGKGQDGKANAAPGNGASPEANPGQSSVGRGGGKDKGKGKNKGPKGKGKGKSKDGKGGRTRHPDKNTGGKGGKSGK